MDVGRVVGWYEHYAGAFSAYARGDTDDPALLSDFYGVPLLISTPESLISLASEADVLQAVRSQAEALRAAGYAESDLLTLDVTPLNATSALVQVEVSRRRFDETEIERLRFTELVVETDAGLRIAALAVHAD